MKNPNPKILIIDDEPHIRKFLRVTLIANDYDVCEAHNGQTGIDAATLEKPNLILLDLGLPDINGFDVIKMIRSWTTHIPIIVISARDSADDIVLALDTGANDYMTKPFDTPTLLARIRVALRQAILSIGENPVLHFKHVTVDFAQRVVYAHDQRIHLSKKEFEIIKLLATHSGKVITQDHLLREIWGEPYINNTEYLRTYIGQLRKKLELDYKKPEIILTETGIGYRFCEPTK